MSKRILVVEDQPDNRQIIRDMLAGTDYEITEAEDGEQALSRGGEFLPPRPYPSPLHGQNEVIECASACPLLAQSGHSLRCNAMSAFGGKADMDATLPNVRF